VDCLDPALTLDPAAVAAWPPGRWWKYVRTRCLNKVAYASEAASERARLQRLDEPDSDDGRGPGDSYRCDLCDWWHWGRLPEDRVVLPDVVFAECRPVVRARRSLPGALPTQMRYFEPTAPPPNPEGTVQP